jgi:hypothetical protein
MITEHYEWEVRRRLSDFRWLSERLRREFPHLNIRLFNCETVKEIEEYVNSLLKIPLILKSRFFIFFLSCNNSTKFYERRDKEFKQNVIKSISKKFEGMLDTVSSQQDCKSIFYSKFSISLSFLFSIFEFEFFFLISKNK